MSEFTYSARGLRAKELFEQGYNCCQAVLLAFSDVTGLDDEVAAKISSSFGGGIGRLREVCGTFSGACMVLGMIEGAGDPKAQEAKAAQYAKIQELAKKFAEDNGSYVCREILQLRTQKSEPTPDARTPEYYKKRPCGELCAYSATLLENMLLNGAKE